MDDRKPKVLVAEDDRALADIIRCALHRAGMEVTIAYDGQRALNAARRSAFDVIISDYQMPKLNGEQLLRSVRFDSASRDARLFFCSAKAYEIQASHLVDELGIVRVLYKPFSLSELTCLVSQSVGDAGQPNASHSGIAPQNHSVRGPIST